MNVCESLTSTAKLFPDRTALIWQERGWTYSQLDALSMNAAMNLQSLGVESGDRVAVMLPNSPEFVVWYYGGLRLGAIAVSISTRLTPTEVEFVLEDSGATVLVASDDQLAAIQSKLQQRVSSEALRTCSSDLARLSPELQEASPPWVYAADPDEPALILYTSGTTGFPKGATLSHQNVRSNVCAFNHLCHMQPDDRILLGVPLFHCFGQNALLNSALNVGATLVLQDGFDLHETKRLIHSHQITQLYGVPMMFQLLLESCEPKDLASVNYCFSAAASLPVPTSERWLAKFGLPIHEGYGLTETSPFASYNHRLQYKLGSIGTPIDCVEMKIVDAATGEDCSPGKLGEIAIRGPNVMLGYWNRPEETAEVIRQGWFHSGDLGRVDEDGFFYIVDRVKDMIAVGGLKVFPAEVERVLLELDEVSEAAVIGTPDPVFGEQVCAFVVLQDRVDREEALRRILETCKENLANYKLPRSLISIDALPRNPSGKILKTRLREMAQNPSAEEVLATTAATLGGRALKAATLRDQLKSAFASERTRMAIEFVQDLVSEIGNLPERIDPATRFLDAGLDSMMLVELALQVQVEVGEEHELSTTLIFDFPRLEDLGHFLVATLDDPIETLTNDRLEALSRKRDAPDPVAKDHDAINHDAINHDAINHDAKHETQADLHHQIAALSEDEALAELMKELE